MKKALLPMLFILALLLTGCGGRAGERRFADFSETLGARETLAFSAAVRAEYSDRTLSFSLAYEKNAEGETITVVEPGNIAGIRAHLKPGGSTIEFEGLILDAGPLDPYGLTPMNALPKLVEALSSGHLDSHGREGDEKLYRLILDDQLSVSVWFEPESMTPTHAELQSGEKVCIFCDITNWR